MLKGEFKSFILLSMILIILLLSVQSVNAVDVSVHENQKYVITINDR